MCLINRSVEVSHFLGGYEIPLRKESDRNVKLTVDIRFDPDQYGQHDQKANMAQDAAEE
jgi:hypothetical protein